MKTYKVWFTQINADLITVRANDGESARKYARKIWMDQNLPAEIETVTMTGDDDENDDIPNN